MACPISLLPHVPRLRSWRFCENAARNRRAGQVSAWSIWGSEGKRKVRWKNGLAAVAAVVVAGAGLAWAATRILNVPDPIQLLSLDLAQPSTAGTLFASRTIPASSHPRPLLLHELPWPPDLPWKGERVSVPRFLRLTSTKAFVALHEGAVIAEWYDRGISARTPLASWSVAKSIVSLLVGQSIAAGHLRETDRLVDVLPDLRKAGADPRITVRNLLDMTSGTNVPETYDAWRFWRGTTGMYLAQD
jgi:hypothetical protein